MIIPPKGYTAIRLLLRLIERDFWSARHTVTFALWAQLAYAYFIVVCVFGLFGRTSVRVKNRSIANIQIFYENSKFYNEKCTSSSEKH